MVDLRIGRVDVFLLHALCTRVEQSASEGHHLPTDIQPREDHTTAISVVDTFLIFNTEACLYQELLLIAFGLGCLCHSIALGGRESQLKLLDDIIADATATEILLTDGLSVYVVIQDIMEVVPRPLVDDKHRLTLTLFALFFIGELTFLYLDIVFLRQPAQGFGIGNLLMLHEERHRSTALPTGETMTDILGGRDHERGGCIIVKRTQSLIVDTCFAQCHKLAHHIHDVGSIDDLVYRRPVNHQKSSSSSSSSQSPRYLRE